jgi:HK97 family phage major capsid protein
MNIQFIEKAFDDGKLTIEEFREFTAAARAVDKAGKLDLTAREAGRYSLLRAIEAQVTGNWDRAGFEAACSKAIEEQTGRPARGFYIPYDVPFGAERVLTAGTSTTGAEMVGTDQRGFIDALREKALTFILGSQVLSGLVGDVSIPSMADATFYHVTEDADVTDSTPTTSSVSLTPKTVGGSVPVSRRLWKQSSPGIEATLKRMLVAGVSVEMDSKVLNGSGSAGQPLGILGQSGIGTVTVTTAGQPDWAELVEFESDILAAKALSGSLGYLVTPAVYAHCKTTLKAAGIAGYLVEDGKCNGYQIYPTTHLPTNGILFGNYESLLVGIWGGIDVKVDEATKAAAGGLVIRVFVDYDVAVDHAESFSKNA